jgi:hypothetical protein
MKKTGGILLIIGFLLVIITGFGFFTKKKVVDIGRLQISKNEPHRLNWSPYLGAGIMVAGCIVLLAAKRDKSL